MTLECNVWCRAISVKEEEALGLEDPGVWIPCVIDLRVPYSVKMYALDEEDPMYGLASLYFPGGDIFIVDVKYTAVRNLWLQARGVEPDQVTRIQPPEASL